VIRERIFVAPTDKIQVVQGILGNDAGILGTAKWAEVNN
jgi:hypothetical protein